MIHESTGRLVLIVDDEPAVLRVLEQWLRADGYAVVSCSSYEDAREQMAALSPDVLIADVRLGPFNGLQLIIAARQQRPDIVTLVISAFEDQTLRDEALRNGACYVVKPLSRESVLRTIAEAGNGRNTCEDPSTAITPESI